MTMWRMSGGFLLATALALPLGVLMGAYKPIEAFFEPFLSFARYLPASGFIPLLILWVGIGEAQRPVVIFIGSFFQRVSEVSQVSQAAQAAVASNATDPEPSARRGQAAF